LVEMRMLVVSACAAVAMAAGCGSEDVESGGGEILTGTQPLLNGEPQRLSEYRGDVVMVVNTASECGFTPQFEQLEDLYRDRRGEGFVILGFPADDVAGQEPRSDAEIAEFCEANFGVSFPMFAKTNVVGEEANPLFRALAAEAGEPSWNFNKYLLDRDGQVVARYDASEAPDDPELVERIDELLSERA
jgi:glutathione peroxidase